MDDRLYWIWLQNAFIPGNPRSDAVLRELKSARAVFETSAEELKQFDLTHAEYKKLKDRSLEPAARILESALLHNGWVLTPEDVLYPSMLTAIQGMPLVLYGKGDFPDLDIFPSIAVVGTRAISAYGRRITAVIAGGLALGGAVIISGGASGVDSAAHKAALAAQGKTVAVLGCGVDVVYPPQNRGLFDLIAGSGAVVSEYPPGTPPLRHHFPQRNRLISGMSHGVCITEAPEKSGALITAYCALEQGRDVFAVAGDMLTGRSAGTDKLIRRGAQLVTGANEILEEYLVKFPDIIDTKAASKASSDSRFVNLDSESTPAPARTEIRGPKQPLKKAGLPDSFSKQASRLYELLSERPRKLDEMIGLTDMSASQAMTALTELELAGIVSCMPGQVFGLN